MKYSIATALLLASIEALCDPNCTWDEAKNPEGPNQCSNSCECSGDRTCSPWGWCEGVSGCPARSDSSCDYDEAKNPLGPNRCTSDN